MFPCFCLFSSLLLVSLVFLLPRHRSHLLLPWTQAASNYMSQFPAHTTAYQVLGRSLLVIEPWQWKITDLYQLTINVLQRQGFLISPLRGFRLARSPFCRSFFCWIMLDGSTLNSLNSNGSFQILRISSVRRAARFRGRAIELCS